MFSDNFPNLRPARSIEEAIGRVGYSIERLLAEIEFSATSDLVAITGSLVEGFGNVTSDIDIFICSAKASEKRSRTWMPEDSNRWIDCAILPLNLAQELEATFSRLSTRVTHFSDCHIVSLDQIDQAHRIHIAIPLCQAIANQVNLPTVCFRKLKDAAAITHCAIARARWIDATGALRSGHQGQAKYAAQIGYWHAIDAICALAGETNPSSKWRYAKCSRLLSSPATSKQVAEMIRQAFSLAFGSKTDASSLIKSLGEAIYFSIYFLIHGDAPPDTPICTSTTRIEPTATSTHLVEWNSRSRRET